MTFRLFLAIFTTFVVGLCPAISAPLSSDHESPTQSIPTQVSTSPTVRAIKFTLGSREELFDALVSRINKSPEDSETLAQQLATLIGIEGMNLIKATDDYSWLTNDIARNHLSAIVHQATSAQRPETSNEDVVTQKPNQPLTTSASSPPTPRGIGSSSLASQKYSELVQMKNLLSTLPLPNKFDSFQKSETNPDLAKVQSLMRRMAHTYTELFDYHRRFPGKDVNDFPIIEDINEILRKQTGAERYGGVSPAEVLWENELSMAMAESGVKRDTGAVLDALAKNRGSWAAHNSMGSSLPNLKDAARTIPSYDLSKSALVALGIASWASSKIKNGSNLTESERQLVEKTLSTLFSHPYFSTPDRGPDSAGKIDLGQISTWGKIYSLDVINLISSDPQLLKLAPQKIKDSTQRASLVKTIQDNLFLNLTALKSNPAMEDGIGGSFFHTSLTFAAFGVLRKEQIDFLYPKFRMIREAKGDGTWPYTPARGPNSGETRRSSSARAAPVALTQLIHDPSEKSANEGVKALEQLFNFSGSLKAHVAREGVHSGEDYLAPYYWAPGLQSAGKLAKQLSDQQHLLSPEYKARLSNVINNLTNSARASYETNHGIITHPGVATFQQLGPTFSTSLTMNALHNLELAANGLSKSRETPRGPSLTERLKKGLPQTEAEIEAVLQQFDELADLNQGIDGKKIKTILDELKIVHTTGEFNLLITRTLSQTSHQLSEKEKAFLIEAAETYGDDLISQKIREMAKLALSKRNIASQ